MSNIQDLNLGKPIGGATQPHPTTGEHGTGAGVSGGVSRPPWQTLMSSTLTPTLPTLSLAVNTPVNPVSTPVSVVTTPRLVSPRTDRTPLPTSSWVNLASKTLSAVPTEVDPLVMPLPVRVGRPTRDVADLKATLIPLAMDMLLV